MTPDQFARKLALSYFADGWDANAKGDAFDPSKPLSWRSGWKDASKHDLERPK